MEPSGLVTEDMTFDELCEVAGTQFGTKTITYVIDTNARYTESKSIGSDALTPATITPTKSGYNFVGWREDSVASDIVLTTKTVDNDLVLYDVFSKTITLSYNGNGASDTTSSQTGTQYYNNGNITNPSFTLKNNGFTVPTNKSFQKWALGSTSGTQYTAGSTVTLSNNTIFYAIWSIKILSNYV